MSEPELVDLNYSLNARPSEAPSIGLLALAEDATIEADLHFFLSDMQPDIYSARIPCDASIDERSLAAMGDRLDASLAQLVPSTPVDVLAYGCTSGAMVLGHDKVRQAVQRRRPGVDVTNPLLAARRWMDSCGIKRIAVLLPYVQPLADQVGQALVADSERELAVLGSFHCALDPQVARISPRSVVHGVKNMLTGVDVDGVFIACTALRLQGVIEELSNSLSLPVSGSNHALSLHIRELCTDEGISYSPRQAVG